MTPQLRILAVDDERLIRMSLRYALGREGYAVDTASDGAEAMALLGERTYDLIVLDLRLPDVSGLELLRYVRRLYPEAKVILVTASSNAPSCAEARQAGAASVLLKPFKLSALAEETRRVMGEASPRTAS
jgi:DNA-binding response OmpR family regulator